MDALRAFVIFIAGILLLGILSLAVSAIGFDNYWFWAPKKEAVGILFFAVGAIGFGSYWFWAPKQEAVRREVFEQTKSYRDGLRRDFDNLFLQYETEKDPDAKAAILSVIRHRADGVDPDFVPDNIHNLLRSN